MFMQVFLAWFLAHWCQHCIYNKASHGGIVSGHLVHKKAVGIVTYFTNKTLHLSCWKQACHWASYAIHSTRTSLHNVDSSHGIIVHTKKLDKFRLNVICLIVIELIQMGVAEFAFPSYSSNTATPIQVNVLTLPRLKSVKCFPGRWKIDLISSIS